MALLDDLFFEITVKNPRLEKVKDLLAQIGAVSTSGGATATQVLDDEGALKLIHTALGQYQIDMHNEARRRIIFAVLNDLKAKEHASYVKVLLNCYDRFNTLVAVSEGFVPNEYLEAEQAFYQIICTDRLTEAHFQKCKYNHHLVGKLYDSLIEDIDLLTSLPPHSDMKPEVKIQLERLLSLLMVDGHGHRSLYSTLVFTILLLTDLYKPEKKIEGLVALHREAVKKLGSKNHLAESLALPQGIKRELVKLLELKVLSSYLNEKNKANLDRAEKITDEHIPTLKALITILKDCGVTFDVAAPATQAELRSHVDAFLLDAKESPAAFMALLEVLRMDVNDRFIQMGDGEWVGIIRRCYNSESINFPALILLFESGFEHLKINEEDAKGLYDHFIGTVNKWHGQKNPYGLEAKLLETAVKNAQKLMVTLIKSKKLEGSVLYFDFLELADRLVKGESFPEFGEVLLSVATEADKAKIVSYEKAASPHNNQCVTLFNNLLQRLTLVQSGQLMQDIVSGAKSRLGLLFEAATKWEPLSNDYITVYKRLIEKCQTAPAGFLLKLPMAEKRRLGIVVYAEQLSWAELPLNDIMKELEATFVTEPDELQQIGRVIEKLCKNERFTPSDVFMAMPQSLKNALSAKQMIATLQKAGLVYRQMPPYLSDIHKQELKTALIRRCRVQFEAGFIFGTEEPPAPPEPNHWMSNQKAENRYDENTFTFLDYRALGIDLDSELDGETLLDNLGGYKPCQLNEAKVYFQSRALQNHQDLTRRLPLPDGSYKPPYALQRIIATSLACLDDAVFNEPRNELLGLGSMVESFILRMIDKEFTLPNQGSFFELNEPDYMFTLNAQWSRTRGHVEHWPVRKQLSDRASRWVQGTQLDPVMGVAMAWIPERTRYSAEDFMITFRGVYSELLRFHPALRVAVRRKMVLGGTCLFLNVLRSFETDQGFILADTQEFNDVRNLLKSEPVSKEDVIDELAKRVAVGQPPSPRDAVLYLALNKELKQEEFNRIAKHHLDFNSPLESEYHAQLVEAMKLLSDDDVKALKLKLDLLIVLRDSELKLKFKDLIKIPNQGANQNLLWHVIAAGKRFCLPKNTGNARKVKGCLKHDDYSTLKVYSIFKVPVPADFVIPDKDVVQSKDTPFSKVVGWVVGTERKANKRHEEERQNKNAF